MADEPKPADPRDRLRTVSVRSVRLGDSPLTQDDAVATEEPLEIRIDDRPLAVVMRTPGDDIPLAAGFLHAEAIITDSDDVATIKHCTTGTDAEFQNVVQVRLSDARKNTAEAMLQERMAQRSTVTSASCGVCGKQSIESLQIDAPPFDSLPKIDPQRIAQLPQQLRAAQEVFEKTGGLHAAAVFDAQGKLLVLKEDVGRHNAVDKIAGWMFRRGENGADKIFYTTGRMTSEMVTKTAMMGIPVLASRSGFTASGVEIARQVGLTLIGRMRGKRFICVSGAERLTYDIDLSDVPDEAPRHRRKGAAQEPERET